MECSAHRDFMLFIHDITAKIELTISVKQQLFSLEQELEQVCKYIYCFILLYLFSHQLGGLAAALGFGGGLSSVIEDVTSQVLNYLFLIHSLERTSNRISTSFQSTW